MKKSSHGRFIPFCCDSIPERFSYLQISSSAKINSRQNKFPPNVTFFLIHKNKFHQITSNFSDWLIRQNFLTLSVPVWSILHMMVMSLVAIWSPCWVFVDNFLLDWSFRLFFSNFYQNLFFSTTVLTKIGFFRSVKFWGPK